MDSSFQDIYARRIETGGLQPDPAQQALIPGFQRMLDALAAPPPRARGLFSRRAAPEPVRGLYLWGGVGRGKSMLMDMFFEAAPLAGKRRVHFHAFMQEIHAGIARARKTGTDDAIRPVAEEIADGLRLLCFDEMQITDITDAMIVGRLFEKLFEAGVTVVATSNRPPSDLYKNGLNRQLFTPFIALLEERLEIHELAAERDYRQDRIGGTQVYFHPADKAARMAVDSLWEELTGGGGAPLTLRIKGRDVVLAQAASGVARCDFWDLCGRPLGAADYLAVAEAVRVLMLENVPLLSSENYNEARRFVTLVDALYEARRQVVISAAAPPEDLYVEGEGLFEFERTASRLREMQSEGWGTGD
ncbi:cell division protein ZapE [Profundibacterium mesophilum]|uniref:Chromosomal replication initiator protein n=1 Tax=Profundibacterium mesophilum KAUST100406-0324 TaxID=1037889 RepID=A0A921NVA3_9RHOB|nr:cell division protein ZapE [Profundibacterium mesophilum]KAF0677329.1 chromosomal replication initiator protein [Profundibacterium mesophilum KAUST100406-0324]